MLVVFQDCIKAMLNCSDNEIANAWTAIHATGYMVENYNFNGISITYVAVSSESVASCTEFDAVMDKIDLTLPTAPVLRESPSLVVITHGSIIEALKETSSWIYVDDNGDAAAIMGDSNHPLLKKASTPIIILALIVFFMLILPLITIQTVKADAGMLVTLLLFFVVHPAVSIAVGILAGKDMKFFWPAPAVVAALFWLFSTFTYETAFPIVYSAAYLVIGTISMLITWGVSKSKLPGYI